LIHLKNKKKLKFEEKIFGGFGILLINKEEESTYEK
jgi:hypothetical protein